MPEYKRNFIPGGTYFFTVVTYHRILIFNSEYARSILHASMDKVKEKHPFETVAICLLPEHLHCIWTLPERDSSFSMRWKEIEKSFTREYLAKVGMGEKRNNSHPTTSVIRADPIAQNGHSLLDARA